MLAVDPTLLKPWLIKHLEPISDADPATLSDYVLALLKHDVSDDDLEKLCIEQLKDFLDSHTEKFVKEMLAFAKSPKPLSSPVASNNSTQQRKRPLEPEHVAANKAPRSERPTSQGLGPMNGAGPSGQNAGNGQMCRDYHMRGFCARGQSCPYQHDAFATSSPANLPNAFPPFLPFGGPPLPQQQQQQQQMYHGRPGPPFPMMMPNGAPPAMMGYPPFQQNYPYNQQPPQIPHPQGRSPYPSAPLEPHAYPSTHPSPQSYPPPPPSNRRIPSSSGSKPFPPRHPPFQRSTSSSTKPPTPATPSRTSQLVTQIADNAAKQKDLLSMLDASNDKKSIMSELRRLGKEAEELLEEKKKVQVEEEEKGKKEEGEVKEEKAGEEEKIVDPKAHLEKLRSEAASLGIQSSPGGTITYTKPPPSRRYPPPHYAAPHRYQAPLTAKSFKLDNRSTNIVIDSVVEVGEGGEGELKSYFETFGPLKDFKLDQEKQEVYISFSTRAVAEKAMSAGLPPSISSSSDSTKTPKLRWAPATPASASTASSTSTPTVSAGIKAGEASNGERKREEGEEGKREESGLDHRFTETSNGDSRRRDDDDDDERSWNR